MCITSRQAILRYYYQVFGRKTGRVQNACIHLLKVKETIETNKILTLNFSCIKKIQPEHNKTTLSFIGNDELPIKV